MKTIAIATVFQKRSGDVWNHVLGLDMTMEATIEQYKHDWWRRADKHDKARTELVYVSIVPIPEETPEDGEVFQWYDNEITLPEFWLETADTKDVIKNGKELVTMKYVIKNVDYDDENLQGLIIDVVVDGKHYRIFHQCDFDTFDTDADCVTELQDTETGEECFDYEDFPGWVWKIIDKVTSMKHISYRDWMSPELWDGNVASGTIVENK